ncbi:hypothetical protein MPL3356_70349 [Mesorhizobium plurifarium]|uniref:Uncharacterized protein n=1 Tax=Mesorhizobium plurifarium TaxID=69974 RepID=A0A090GAD9_MESPL|nr:hypothetical protein MPL3356_70349 [Mesorhizobium plurifarium]
MPAHNILPAIDAIDGVLMAHRLFEVPVAEYGSRLEHRKTFEQRNDSNDDDDDLRDLARAGVERQTLHEIEHQDHHQEGDQYADKNRYAHVAVSFPMLPG